MPTRKPFQKWERYHIYNRGRKGQRLFYHEPDYQKMLQAMFLFKNRFKGFRILAYSFLPNHFHLIIKVSRSGLEVSKFICKWCSGYANYFITKHHHEKGTRLFENNFRAKKIDSFWYRKQALYYIENNPIRHKIVDSMDEWKFASDHTSKDKDILFDFHDPSYDWEYFEDWEFPE